MNDNISNDSAITISVNRSLDFEIKSVWHGSRKTLFPHKGKSTFKTLLENNFHYVKLSTFLVSSFVARVKENCDAALNARLARDQHRSENLTCTWLQRSFIVELVLYCVLVFVSERINKYIIVFLEKHCTFKVSSAFNDFLLVLFKNTLRNQLNVQKHKINIFV